MSEWVSPSYTHASIFGRVVLKRRNKQGKERERARERYKSKADYCVWETVEEGTFSRRICRHIVHDWVDASQRASSAYHSRNDGETRRRLSRDPYIGQAMQGATGLIVSHLEFKTAAAAAAVFLILLRWRLPSAVSRQTVSFHLIALSSRHSSSSSWVLLCAAYRPDY